ncbi:MAG: NUDIX domain-containing protein [Clostridia bacterium]|nr:NUDIX domain-containing protein [Clostridia bacterium]
MAGLGDYTLKNNARQVLGTICTITVKKSYRTFLKGKFAGYLNFGYTVIGKVGVKEVILIGEKYPVNKFNAQIIALAHDKSGAKDDIYIAAKENSIYYEPNIVKMVSRFIPEGSADFVCYYEKSCGAVLYTEVPGERKYILITNISGHIGFPKGHVEFGETEKETALREIYEETGIHTEIIDGFREYDNYKINNFIKKKAIYFLAKFDPKDIKMDIMEISEYRLLNYEDAMKTLNFKHDKKILEKAENFINKLSAENKEVKK